MHESCPERSIFPTRGIYVQGVYLNFATSREIDHNVNCEQSGKLVFAFEQYNGGVHLMLIQYLCTN